MISREKITEIFCLADDFCKEFEVEMHKIALSDTNKKRIRIKIGSKSNTVACKPRFTPVTNRNNIFHL